jgi:hypothetical protein
MRFIDIYVLEDTMNTVLCQLQFSGMLQPVTLLISVKSWKNLLPLPSEYERKMRWRHEL